MYAAPEMDTKIARTHVLQVSLDGKRIWAWHNARSNGKGVLLIRTPLSLRGK
jgi:hypothetical protein